MKNKKIFLLIFMSVFVFSCDESLPPRIVPQNTLVISNIYISQGTDIRGIHISMLIEGENIYEDNFQDTVNVTGNIKIWWLRNPEISAKVKLNNFNFVEPTRIQGRVLTIDPNEKFYLEAKWYLDTDSDKYLIDLLDFTNNDIEGEITTAKPEKFAVKAQVIIFDQIGLITSDRYEFIFVGWKVVDINNP